MAKNALDIRWSLLLLLVCTPLSAATVIKSNTKFFVVSANPSGPWKVLDTLCAVHKGTTIACGKVTKVAQNGSALVQISTRPNPKLTLAVGDTVNRTVARTTASESQIGTVIAAPSKYTSKFQVSAELLGAGLFYQVFGSYRFADHFAANLGISYFSVSGTTTATANGQAETANASVSLVQVPLSVSALIGDGPNSFFEVLGGVDIVFGSESANAGGIGGSASEGGLIIDLGVGYRYWPPQGGFHFRATLYGIYSALTSNILPWPAVSFGYAF